MRTSLGRVRIRSRIVAAGGAGRRGDGRHAGAASAYRARRAAGRDHPGRHRPPPPARRLLAAVAGDVPQGDADRGRDTGAHRTVRRRLRSRPRGADPGVGRKPRSDLRRRGGRLLPGDAGHLPRSARRHQHRGGHQVPQPDDPPVRARGLRRRRLQRRSRPGPQRPPAARDPAVPAVGRRLPQRPQVARDLRPAARRRHCTRGRTGGRRLVVPFAAHRPLRAGVADAQSVPGDAAPADRSVHRLPGGAADGPADAGRRRPRRVPDAPRRQLHSPGVRARRSIATRCAS